MADQNKRGTFIHGIASSEHLDSSGERIKIEGVDISSLTKDGVFNYEHNSKEASSIVGKILEAKKIIKRSDCETDHQKYFWDKIKMPYIYVAGELFDAVGHKEAGEVAAMVRYDQQEPINKDAKKLINFSIEGSRMEKQGAIITKCIARKISITLTPCNKVCEAEELKADPKEEKQSDSGKFAFIQDVMSKSDEPSCQIMKGEIPFLYKAVPAMTPPKMAAPAAPKKPKIPKKPVTNIARPDKGFGAIIDKTPKVPAKPNYGKVIVKAKSEVKKKKDTGPLQKPYASDAQRRWAHTATGTEALGGKEAVAHWDKESKGKNLPEVKKKKKLGKYDSNVRKALTASCGLGASPSAKVQGDAVAKAEWPQYKPHPPHPKFFENHKGLIPKNHPDHAKAIEHINHVHNSGRRVESRRLYDRYISGGGSFTKVETGVFYLAKASKNVREQRKKVFGSKSQPGAKTPMREKHLDHIKNFVDKFLGLDLQPSGGKINSETGERRDENPEIGVDKPDWRSGQLESQWNPEAAIHEIAHVMLLPKGMGLEEGQRWMDKNYGDVQSKYGYMQQKRSKYEVQPMAAEQLIRRVMGLPASQVSIPVKSKNAPPRMGLEDPSEVIGNRVQQGQQKSGEPKYVDLIRQAKHLHPENRQRLEDIFTKKVVFDPDYGWIPNNKSLHAAISNRKPGAVIARQEKRQAKQSAASQELPPNVVRIKKPSPAPMPQAPQESQDQVNPPEMAQEPKFKMAKSEQEFDPDIEGWLEGHPNEGEIRQRLRSQGLKKQPAPMQNTGDITQKVGTSTNVKNYMLENPPVTKLPKERESRGGTSLQGQAMRAAGPQFDPDIEAWLEGHPNAEELRQNLNTIRQHHLKAASNIVRQRFENLKKQPKLNLVRSEVNKVMKILGDQAFERFEKKEELVKFLSEKLPNVSEKERMAIAKAVAYTNEKKKELVLRSLLEKDNEPKV